MKVDDFGQQTGLQKAAESLDTAAADDDDIPALEDGLIAFIFVSGF